MQCFAGLSSHQELPLVNRREEGRAVESGRERTEREDCLP